ncbi:MAG: hypothetical protein QXD43_02385 [Candidatus Aenigmatarchaeota archaeon]
MKKLTELEKTALITFLVFMKKNKNRGIFEEEIVLKFPMRQRKNVREAIESLKKSNFLIKKDGKTKLSEKGMEEAMKLLKTGAKLWAYLK